MDTRNGVIGDTDPRYKFTGKERDVETQYDYFGARYYDSRIGRWLSVDPMAEKFPNWCPYCYALGDPLRMDDPDGRGARDRVKAARVLLAGIPYKQEPGQISFRTQWTPEALQFIDCSELVNRVLFMDNITTKVMNWSTTDLKTYFGGEGRFAHSSTPQLGDFALWLDATGGHVAVVTEVNEDKRVKYSGAWHFGTKSGEKGPWRIGSGSHHKFLGYFRPLRETPDDKLQNYGSLGDYVKSLSRSEDSGHSWPSWWMVPLKQFLDRRIYAGSDATSGQN